VLPPGESVCNMQMLPYLFVFEAVSHEVAVLSILDPSWSAETGQLRPMLSVLDSSCSAQTGQCDHDESCCQCSQ